jgi:DNA ligase (NAD+)
VKVTAKGDGGVFKIPLECPVCHSPAAVDGADVRCANGDCPAWLSGRVAFFASKECMDIDGFGPAVADALTEDGYVKSLPDIYLHFREHGAEIRALLDAGVKPVMRTKPSGGAFFGKTFVITGTLPSMDRRKAEEIITENGGKVSSGVSKNTDFLLAGESAGSKLEKAKSLGITILSEDDLLSMLGS